jgi:hypothetical protein
MVLVVTMSLSSCTPQKTEESNTTFYDSSKPRTRWWWYATHIEKEAIKEQLDWLKRKNFGGVEIAWVYPLYRYNWQYERLNKKHYAKDSSAQKWLSPEWIEIATYAKQYADSIGLSCDFTFGSSWPAAGSNITKEHSVMVYGDTSFRQKLTFAWTYPEEQLVVNHLDPEAFRVFAGPIAEALKEPLKGSKSALFTDSWEIKLNGKYKLWTPGFDSTFKEEFGYDIIPFMEAGLDSFPDVRYDYMLHLDHLVTEGFYRPYAEKCRELGAWSRVQCLAAPTDVMSTYALVDIPETEAMLNNPNYSRVVSSSACLASKPMVSCESFTCMYGFPATYIRDEQTADVKMVADGLFTEGVNQHFYHGFSYNPVGSDSNEFIGSVHFGPGGNLEEELADFNAYMEKVSGYMQKGRTYTNVAVYVPYEDAVMAGALPEEKRRVWVWGHYELRYVFTPDELEGYHPIWINRYFLDKGVVKNKKLHVGDAVFNALYMDVEYLDVRALRQLVSLAKKGLPVCLKQSPTQPGKNKSEDFKILVKELMEMENVQADFSSFGILPLIEGDTIPPYWSRVDKNGSTYIFLAHEKSRRLAYPIYSGQAFTTKSITRDLTFHVNGNTIQKTLTFEPYQSLMLEIKPNGEVINRDIYFKPKDPKIKPREPQRMHF